MQSLRRRLLGDLRSGDRAPRLQVREPGTFVSLLQTGEPFGGEVAEGHDHEPDEINDRQGETVAGRLAGENAAGRRKANPWRLEFTQRPHLNHPRLKTIYRKR